jgi:hypothetical protein
LVEETRGCDCTACAAERAVAADDPELGIALHHARARAPAQTVFSAAAADSAGRLQAGFSRLLWLLRFRGAARKQLNRYVFISISSHIPYPIV